MLKEGWLDRQIQNATQDVKSWPQWMQREGKVKEADSTEKHNAKTITESSKKS
jgi:hypothetical protein